MGQLDRGLGDEPGSLGDRCTGACDEYEYDTGRDHGW